MKRLLYLFVLLSAVGHTQTFNDVAQTAGIDHLYDPLNAMGGGAVFFDYDNDGWEDLYITGGHGIDHLYQNNQDGTFTNVTATAGLSITEDFYTIASIAGDIDNDGDQDLFVTTWGPTPSQLQRNLFFVNNGNGTFTESGESYGFTGVTFSMGASFIDYNLDGLLDVYVVNYVETPGFLYDENGQVNGFSHTCFPNQFYHNNGDGTFTEMASTLGVDNVGCALAIMTTDYDMDNDMDLYIANDFGEWVIPNTMLENEYPTQSFTDVSTDTGSDVAIYGMGIASADMDKDGDFDYYITNLGRNVLIENDGTHNFQDITTAAGVENTYALDDPGDFFTTGWGTAFLDVNNDTWPDLFVANGKVGAEQFIANGTLDPNKLYLNNGDNTFTDISDAAGVSNQDVARGMAYSDYDKDGDVDIVVVIQDGIGFSKTQLLQNTWNDSSRANGHWAQFDLEGTKSNWDALGAKVKLTVGSDVLLQEVQGSGPHCGQNSSILHFGLGANTTIDKVEVIWPGGDVQDYGAMAVDARHQLVEGQTLSAEDVAFADMNIYPNPTTGIVHTTLAQDLKQVNVYSLLGGKVIQLSDVANAQTFDLSSLPPGMYYMEFLATERREVRKLMVK